jgi:squalene-hopene/tetraprenyl-beta-curcumene cyclase
VEETALAAEALLTCGDSGAYETAAWQGIKWLTDTVEANRHQNAAPIGFYFARLWYYEKLYPLVTAVAALGQAVRRVPLQPSDPPAFVHSKR